MSVVIHVLKVDKDGDCCSMIIPFDSIEFIECEHGSARPGTSYTPDPRFSVITKSSYKNTMTLNSKAVFRIIDNGVIIFKETSLKKFEIAMINLFQNGGAYRKLDKVPGAETEPDSITMPNPS